MGFKNIANNYLFILFFIPSWGGNFWRLPCPQYRLRHVFSINLSLVFAFIRERSCPGAPTVWKYLSIEECPAPRIVFVEKKNLRMCLADKFGTQGTGTPFAVVFELLGRETNQFL